MGLVWWRQVPVSGCGFGALQGDAFCRGASCRGEAAWCPAWPRLSPGTRSPCRALTCPLRVSSFPGARSSTGGSGCTPMRTMGGSSKSETKLPHPCVSPCRCRRLSEHRGSAPAPQGSHLGCWDGGSSPKRGQWWGTVPVGACNWSHSPSFCSASCSRWCLSQVVRRVPPQFRLLGARQAPAHQQGQEVRVHDGQQR